MSIHSIKNSLPPDRTVRLSILWLKKPDTSEDAAYQELPPRICQTQYPTIENNPGTNHAVPTNEFHPTPRLARLSSPAPDKFLLGT